MLNYFIGAEIAKKESSWLALGVIAHKVEAWDREIHPLQTV
jgi:hypothetical protein